MQLAAAIEVQSMQIQVAVKGEDRYMPIAVASEAPLYRACDDMNNAHKQSSGTTRKETLTCSMQQTLLTTTESGQTTTTLMHNQQN